MQNTERKVLLRIDNLKQYFPLKTKGLFVKANDGITLNIYEGETFGLVGESGCGKSTLGRTLLQLYKQTDGRTMYYGRKLEDIAPGYTIDTIKKLNKHRAQYRLLVAKKTTIEAEFEKLEDGGAKYAKQNELNDISKQVNDAMLDMTNLVGGFITIENLDPVIAIFTKMFGYYRDKAKAFHKRTDIQLNLEDAQYYAQKEISEANTAKVKKYHAQLKEIDEQIAAIHAQVEGVRAEIDQMRVKYKDDAEFQKYEAHIDDGIDLARLTYDEIRLLRRDLQLIFQDPYSSLNPRQTVGQIIGEGMLAHKMFKKNDERMQEQIIKTMNDAGLASYFLHRYPHQFSGGQRQRIGIARSLAVDPTFVVCDEAVSALDVSIQSQIINLLKDLKEKKKLTYMFITHDLSVVKYISDRVGVMYLGNMVEMGPSADIFKMPLHPYTEALMAAIPTTDVDSGREMKILEGDVPSPVNPPNGCKFHTRCTYCTEICKHVVPDWEEVSPDHFVACHHRLGVDAE